MTKVALLPRTPAQVAAGNHPPIALADLSTEFHDGPRVHDLLIADRLGFKNLNDVRQLIARNSVELQTYGDLVRDMGDTGNPAKGVLPQPEAKPSERRSGRPTKAYWLNEGQALTICALARTPATARIRRELVTVFLAFRHGSALTPLPAASEAAPLDRMALAMEAMRAELAALRQAVEQPRRRPIAPALAPPHARPVLLPGETMLRGAEVVGAHVGLNRRQVYYLHESGRLPTFKRGPVVCSTARAMDAWLADQVASVAQAGETAQ